MILNVSTLLETIDWVIVGVFFVIVLGIGWVASRTAGKSSAEYFLGGRGMPWWLLGISMVACTFSADTPNLVTGMVREDGIAKNWAWWAFLITGMVTVFIYAKLWRRSNVMTDLEYYEIRYSGKAASFLRGFRSVYLGLFFNCLIMGTVTLAAIKIGGVMLGLKPWVVVVGASIVVVLYSSLGGLKGVIWADFFQYGIAMFGAVYAAVIAVRHPDIGSLDRLFELVPADKLAWMPDFSNTSVLITMFIIPIAVQWWAVWYPGAEPGGGGYIAQRMLAAKDEKNAIGATMLFNFMHYAIRPWPWIIVALASIVIFPNVSDIQAAFPNVDPKYVKDDIAYPAMLTLLSPGWLGLVVASLIAAYMSTIGTHLNWGSSYIVNDFYKRFVKPEATEKQMVALGRISTVALMVLAGVLSLTVLDNATDAFNLLLLTGAGTGLIYILRWFWWRINAWTEVVAMAVATLNAIILVVINDVHFIMPLDAASAAIFNEALSTLSSLDNASVNSLFNLEQLKSANIIDAFTMRLLIAVIVSTVAWIVTTLVTKPESDETLRSFYKLTKPGGPGWKKVIEKAKSEGIDIEGDEKGKAWEMPLQILCVFIGCIVVYTALFGIGSFIFDKAIQGFILFGISGLGMLFLFKSFSKLRAN